MKDNSYSSSPEKDIIYSHSFKAGKRIYYIDVKKTVRNEMYLAITESKRTLGGDEAAQFNFERHKIFVYPEDFDKFTEGLTDVMNFIFEHQGKVEPRREEGPRDINIDDLEF